MTKLVDGREKELTHQVHRMMLIRSLDEVKNLTPVLISGVKMYITAKQTSKYKNVYINITGKAHSKYRMRNNNQSTVPIPV